MSIVSLFVVLLSSTLSYVFAVALWFHAWIPPIIQQQGPPKILRRASTVLSESESVSSELRLLLFDHTAIVNYLDRHGGVQAWIPRITAFLEPPLANIAKEGDRGDANDPKDLGTPPTFTEPLPSRKHAPDSLRQMIYPLVPSCRDMPGKLPTSVYHYSNNPASNLDHPWNKTMSLPPSSSCPVNADPFLPWIHDVFPSVDGTVIHIIAQNKRRCHSGRHDTEFVQAMTPQVALMQPVSVQRISEAQALQQAPELWHTRTTSLSPDAMTTNNNNIRYKLVPRTQVTDGHNNTRFICRFFTRQVPTGRLVELGETLSEYPYNYEQISRRKYQQPSMLTPKGKKEMGFYWTSTLRFTCPVPQNNAHDLPKRIATGELVLTHGNYDAVPLVFLDIVPIRTPVRYQQHYLEEVLGPAEQRSTMDPLETWGRQGHVLPHIQASGRWANIPICQPPRLVTTQHPRGVLAPHLAVTTPAVDDTTLSSSKTTASSAKPHYISACLWASVEFTTRGTEVIGDTSLRFVEWIEFHLLVGLDHFYVYDNSRGAQQNAKDGANTKNLRGLLQPYIEAGLVTYYDWPFSICNNNKVIADSPGEWSSQYAAENSCRTRHAPFSEWLISMDIDEYLVPMGEHTSMKTVLRQAHEKNGVQIMSFRSTRGKLREDKSRLEVKGKGKHVLGRRVKYSNVTFLQAYNCDSSSSSDPKLAHAGRARKQVYRSDYVLYHFVHYSVVTRNNLVVARSQQDQKRRQGRNSQAKTGEDPLERPSNELTEAVMVHAKTIAPELTEWYAKTCQHGWSQKRSVCWIGFPWPTDHYNNITTTTFREEDGMAYNCHINQRLETVWIPKLTQALTRRHTSHIGATNDADGR